MRVSISVLIVLLVALVGASNVEASSSRKHGKSSAVTSKKKKKNKPSATPSVTPTATPSASPTPVEKGETSASPSPSEKKKGAPATVAPEKIIGYKDYPEKIRRLIDAALDLTTKNLNYAYGSADPANGGMDCSGFVFYLLKQSGVPDVPRDSSQQYVWVRKSGNFKAVNSRQDDTFELDELSPGDLLFWTGTYDIKRDPPITHAMIYLGREQGSNQRIMVGSSDGRTYKGESRYGVSVFDFKVARKGNANGGKSPSFIGYGHVPGL